MIHPLPDAHTLGVIADLQAEIDRLREVAMKAKTLTLSQELPIWCQLLANQYSMMKALSGIIGETQLPDLNARIVETDKMITELTGDK